MAYDWCYYSHFSLLGFSSKRMYKHKFITVKLSKVMNWKILSKEETLVNFIQILSLTVSATYILVSPRLQTALQISSDSDNVNIRAID